MTHSHGAHTHGGHTHTHDEQAQLGPTGPGSVVLEIGGEIGALILLAGEHLHGVEIEISPVGQDEHRSHVAIRERQSPGGTQWAAVYYSLREGNYTVWDVDGAPKSVVTVTGGQVATLDWR